MQILKSIVFIVTYIILCFSVKFVSSSEVADLKIYLCSVLMDLVAYFFVFAVLYGAGSRGMPDRECFWLGAIFPLAYMLSSLIHAKILNRKNCLPFLVAGTVLVVASGIVGIVSVSFTYLLGSLVALGAFLAMFFNALQSFIRNRTMPGNLTRSIALYTASWSIGCSLGYIVSGYLYSFGLVAMSAMAAATGLVILIIIHLLTKEPEITVSSDEHVEEGPEGSRPVNHSYVMIGWIMIFTVMFTQRAVATFFPIISAQQGISSGITSLPLFLNYFVQGVFGYWMWRHRKELYRRKSIIISHVAAALIFLSIWYHPTFLVCLAGLCLLGIYAGFVYFCAVYYASNSGNRTFNIGINEFIVGLGSFAGIFCCDWWMRKSGSPAGMYMLCALVTVMSLLFQLIFAKGPLSDFAGKKIVEE